MQMQVQRKAIKFIEHCGLSEVEIMGCTSVEFFGTAKDNRNGNTLIDSILKLGGSVVKRNAQDIWLRYNIGYILVQKFQRSFMFHSFADRQTVLNSGLNPDPEVKA